MDKTKKPFVYSYSSVSTFNQCPLRFKLQYIDRLPILQTEPLIKGNDVHNMVELIINDLNENKEITINISKFKYEYELENFLRLEQLRVSKYENKEDYFNSVCEEKLYDEDLNTVGKLDRVYTFWKGGKVLLDYKTGKVRAKETYYPQLALYTYMYNKKYPDEPITHWEVDWLTEPLKYFIEEINPEIIKKSYLDYVETINKIRYTSTFDAKITPLCLWCSVLYACPRQKEILNRFKGLAIKKGIDIDTQIRKSKRNRDRLTPNVVHSKIRGISFVDVEDLDIQVGDDLILRREPENEFDKNAIAIYWGISKLGYIGKELAKNLAYGIDNGKKYDCSITDITGGTTDKSNIGINIAIKVK